jgi:hypothetical protein
MKEEKKCWQLFSVNFPVAPSPVPQTLFNRVFRHLRPKLHRVVIFFRKISKGSPLYGRICAKFGSQAILAKSENS